MAFSPDYVRLVLAENFADARALWLEPLVAIHGAHLVMLRDVGILDRDAARRLADALGGLDLSALASTPYDPTDEDLYFRVDRLLAEACGADVAGRLHTARSRNDIDMTMYRMRLRGELLRMMEVVGALRTTLADLSGGHLDAIFAAHTHTQPAQPTTLAHYLLAVIEQLERDTARVLAAFRSTNQSPLGACAITGTGFPIDRSRTSQLLGFAEPTGNTYGSIAAVDYLLEATGALSITLVGLGRFIQDLLLWSTVEVGYLRLDDGFVQVSSIMPQKRNPVALEHARALASRGVAELSAIATVAHNTPFGDVVDTEDDLQPLVASGCRLAQRAVELVDVTLRGAHFDRPAMRRRAGASWITATELADTLARDHGMPFGIAHAVTAAVARRAEAPDPIALASELAAVSRDLGYPVSLTPGEIERALSPDHFVAVRKTPGGPAPERVLEALTRARAALTADMRQIADARAALSRADALRQKALSAL